MTQPDKQMKSLASVEYYGPQSIKCDLSVNGDVLERISPTEMQELTYKARQHVEDMIEEILLSKAKSTQGGQRDEYVLSIASIARGNGLHVFHIKAMDNKYSNRHYNYVRPWMELGTNIGPIIVGSRKRVINLDWSNSWVVGTAEKLFAEETCTKGDKMIHAHSLYDLGRYFNKLAESPTNYFD